MSTPLRILLLWGTLANGLWIGALSAQSQEFTWHDPAKIVSAEPCGECHQAEYQVWKASKHATGFKTIHRTQAAERIKKNMGFRLIKRESLCLKCHYLAGYRKEQLRAISGVACESCHGAAKDWLNIHNNYGSGFAYETEPSEHKLERIARSKEEGMLRPDELYEVLANCYQCHTVPHEVLVNIGGHASGSPDFKLLERLGDIRHNFLQAQFDPARTENVAPTSEKRRVIYVSGMALDLEYGLRSAALAKEQGSFIRSVQRRVRSVSNKLRAIAARVPILELDRMLSIAAQAEVKPNNAEALLDSGEKIGEAIRDFIQSQDGTQLGGLDGFILGTEEPIFEGPPLTSIPDAKDDPVTLSQPPAPDQPVYPKKQRLRPRSDHRTLGPGCSCHQAENGWWQKDRHFASIDPFINKSQRHLQIAAAYGLSADEIIKGTSICMDCHGTVITGEETQDVFDGVSCESCHGAAADFLIPHSAENPPNGYVVGRQLGMLMLEDLAVRSEACAQCHYVTDPRLISSGHPTGADFDFVRANQSINHWKQPIASTEALSSAYVNAKQGRGPIPEVTVVEVRQTVAETPAIGQAPRRDLQTPFPRKMRVELPPFPTIADSASIAEILLILKRRLELLYEKTGPVK